MRFRNLQLSEQKQRNAIKFAKNVLKIDNATITLISKNNKND